MPMVLNTDFTTAPLYDESYRATNKRLGGGRTRLQNGLFQVLCLPEPRTHGKGLPQRLPFQNGVLPLRRNWSYQEGLPSLEVWGISRVEGVTKDLLSMQ